MSALNLEQLASDGYCLVTQAADEQLGKRLMEAVANLTTTRQGSRNARRLLETCPAVVELASSRTIRQLVEPVLGTRALVVRGLLFDKAEGANWHVGWHQDLMIPVAHRVDTPGYDAWSIKEGVAHVRPPAEVLERMVTLRLHLDDCPADNGPLMVVPGSHRWGIMEPEQVKQLVDDKSALVCTAQAGDVLVMRPLLLHASRKAKSACHRRVVHLEFASGDLPGELDWWGEANK